MSGMTEPTTDPKQRTDSTAPCRCGAPASADPHPCHGKGYTCRQPARLRFYGATPTALAGMQMKVAAHETWSCDACWAEYTKGTSTR